MTLHGFAERIIRNKLIDVARREINRKTRAGLTLPVSDQDLFRIKSYPVLLDQGPIPAATAGPPLVPGKIECRVMRLDRTVDPNELIESTSPNGESIVRFVHNFSLDPLGDLDGIVLAHEDVWGNLWSAQAGGGGSGTVDFCLFRNTATFDDADATFLGDIAYGSDGSSGEEDVTFYNMPTTSTPGGYQYYATEALGWGFALKGPDGLWRCIIFQCPVSV